MIQRIDTDISNSVLSSEKNIITFKFEAIAEQIGKRKISLHDMNNANQS